MSHLLKKKPLLLAFLSATISLMLCSCISTTAEAPIANLWHKPITTSGQYTIKRHDTLYSIAWDYGLDYRQLAQINDLHSPYIIHQGQVLSLTTHNKPLPPKKQTDYNTLTTVNHWKWPAQGQIQASFSKLPSGNKGIDIHGTVGEPIQAAAAGEVVYSGHGIRGYGNLIIIKHNQNYLSAYAYNKKIFVKTGQRVRIGQRIASMGVNNSGNALLHFEIRKNGMPINPMRYL